MIRKLWLILKFKDVTNWIVNNTIVILTNISRSKGSQAMIFGQLIKYSMRNIFFKEHAENEVGRLLYSRTFVFFKKVLYEIKLRGQHISFFILW